MGELELLGGLGDGVETNEGPWSDGEGCQNGREDARSADVGELTDILGCGSRCDGGGFVKSPDRFHVDTLSFGGDKSGNTEGGGASGQQGG